MKYPKFEQKIQERLIEPAARQSMRPGYGIVMEYDPEDNTATVLMTHPGTDQPGEFYTGVICPTHMGVQQVDPGPGRPCWVEFRDGTDRDPVITHFFNHVYNELEYHEQNRVTNDVPRFMMEL